MKPSFLNLFMKKLPRARVVPTSTTNLRYGHTPDTPGQPEGWLKKKSVKLGFSRPKVTEEWFLRPKERLSQLFSLPDKGREACVLAGTRASGYPHWVYSFRSPVSTESLKEPRGDSCECLISPRQGAGRRNFPF